MSNTIKRVETTHIDEITRTAKSTVQWFLENRNVSGKATHPITHNNKLAVFICGEESFADIASEIKQAKASIDLCCWGFDPGMELVRGNGGTWPRGETYGDLLIAAGKRGVTVRLLVWHDAYVANSPGANQFNMPGYTHDTNPWCSGSGSTFADKISAANSIAILREHRKNPGMLKRILGAALEAIRVDALQIKDQDIPLMARQEYCHSWYDAAFHGLFGGIQIRLRSGDTKAVTTQLSTESRKPSGLANGQAERVLLERFGTHHQKPILIDYAHEHGNKAVGYVMGLNSLTDYWDTEAHQLEDHRREQGGEKEAEEKVQGQGMIAGYVTRKPYRDYACRIQGGALAALYENFTAAWDRAGDDRMKTAATACVGPLPAMCKKAGPDDSPVQIVRTQPEDNDTTIKEAYFQATDIATMAGGYLYIENQYFQYEDWTRHLLNTRQKMIDKWNAVCAKCGKTKEELPVMYVFIVIPVPEREGMVPRTYDALAVLGQQGGLTGQEKLIEASNKAAADRQKLYEKNNWAPEKVTKAIDATVPVLPEVVQHANSINKPDIILLEKKFGLKVCTAMLNVSDLIDGKWRYREIYIHSKLMLVDDLFFTLGSANLNQRSMAVDSEINLSTVNPQLARNLRQRIWTKLSGDMADGGDASRESVAMAFQDWSELMKVNKRRKFAFSEDADKRKLTGFLLPFDDERSSKIRLA